MSDPATAVVDDADHHRFVFREDGAEAELVYRVRGEKLILVHTGVPEAIGGRGIAGRLVQAAVARARSSGETIVPWCPYTRRWLQENPDAAAGITIDWSDPLS